MALSVPQANNKLIKFLESTTREITRNNWFSPYMGPAKTNIFRTDLKLKPRGEQINIPLIAAGRGAAVGVGPLVGNEQSLDNYGWRMWIDLGRQAYVTDKMDEHKSSIDLVALFKPQLDQWAKDLQKDELCQALFALPSEAAPAGLGSAAGQRVNGILFDAATAAQRNTWIGDNSDRILVGDALANYVASNFASSMANITTAMRVSAASLQKLKRRAMNAIPRIYPFKVNDAAGREWFVVFGGLEAGRDWSADATILAADKDARAREGDAMNKNPIFQGGDRLFDGMILRMIPELSTNLPTFYTTAGAAGIRTAPIFLCGQSAAALVWGQMPQHTFRKEDDYQLYRGTGLDMIYGLGKIAKKTTTNLLKEWGIATGFVYAPTDT